MPRTRRSNIRYDSNGKPPANCQFGPRAMCAWTSFPTHRDRLIQDDYGFYIDPRYSSPDINEGTPATGGSYVDGYLSTRGPYSPQE